MAILLVAQISRWRQARGNPTMRGGTVFFDGWLLINQAETGADMRECTGIARMRGWRARVIRWFVPPVFPPAIQFAGVSRRGSSRTNDFTLDLHSFLSLPTSRPPAAARRCRAHRDIRSSALSVSPFLSERKRHLLV